MVDLVATRVVTRDDAVTLCVRAAVVTALCARAAVVTRDDVATAIFLCRLIPRS